MRHASADITLRVTLAFAALLAKAHPSWVTAKTEGVE
jgi:hypothetical protein